MARGSRLRRTRWVAILILLTLVLLYAANVPFYSGSTLGGSLSWRMEHGRLTIDRRPQRNRETFYIAPNSEGLRWSPAWRWHGGWSWMVRIPLWMPLGLSILWSVLAWSRPRPRDPEPKCSQCGYPLRGLPDGAPCPECATPKPAAATPSPR